MNSEPRKEPVKPGTPGAKRRWESWLGGLLLAAVLVGAVLLLWPGHKWAAPPPPSAPDTAAPSASALPGFAKLTGKWIRPDGGYVLDIRLVTSEGRIECGYFNPNPIQVARAEATREGGALEVFVELRDVNYPGCTYRLRYDAQQEALAGVYYQAALGESYDVRFVRLPPETP
jgi:hypothetical protein